MNACNRRNIRERLQYKSIPKQPFLPHNSLTYPSPDFAIRRIAGLLAQKRRKHHHHHHRPPLPPPSLNRISISGGGRVVYQSAVRGLVNPGPTRGFQRRTGKRALTQPPSASQSHIPPHHHTTKLHALRRALTLLHYSAARRSSCTSSIEVVHGTLSSNRRTHDDGCSIDTPSWNFRSSLI